MFTGGADLALLSPFQQVVVYLLQNLVFLYFFNQVGKAYGVDIKSLFQRVSFKLREAVSLLVMSEAISLSIPVLLGIGIVIAELLMTSQLWTVIVSTEAVEPIVMPLVLEIIHSVVLAALFEEVFFRGILLHLLIPYGIKRAIVITSVLFAVSHHGTTLATALIISVFYALLVLKMKSLLPSICLHGIANLIVILVQRMAVDETSTLLLLGVVAFIYGLIVYFLIKKEYHVYLQIPIIWQHRS